MTELLNPDGAWFWLLYTLAGAGVTVAAESFSMKVSGQLQRDVYAAHPPLRALVLIVLWAIWPLIVVSVIAAAVTAAAWWLCDSLVYAVKWCLWKVRVHWSGQEGDGSGEQA